VQTGVDIIPGAEVLTRYLLVAKIKVGVKKDIVVGVGAEANEYCRQ
jgi:hypothetical protein